MAEKTESRGKKWYDHEEKKKGKEKKPEKKAEKKAEAKSEEKEPESMHERHAREVKEMHDRHNKMRDDHHKSMQDEMGQLAERHAAEVQGTPGGEPEPGAMNTAGAGAAPGTPPAVAGAQAA